MMVTNKNILRKRGWKEELQSKESRSFLLFSCQKRVHRIVDLCKLFIKKKINPAKKNFVSKNKNKK